MSKIYTSSEDEETIRQVLSSKGLGGTKIPKWAALRLALALSLRIPTEPDPELFRVKSRGSEYDLEQVTGEGQGQTSRGQQQDFTDAFCALLSVYHKEDLFHNVDRFTALLQIHIRRGLREIRTGWRDSHDFHEFLFQELFSDVPASDSEDTSHLRQLLLTGLREIDVRAEIREEIRGPRLTRYRVYLPDINDLDRLRRGLEKVSFSMGLHQQGIFLQSTDVSKAVDVDVPRPPETWKRLTGSELKRWVVETSPDMALRVFPGVDVLGRPFSFDLALAPHLLIGGTTGSGKSVCLHALLLSLLWQYDERQLQVCLIDPKRVELAPYQGIAQLYAGKVIVEVADAFDVLQRLLQEMEDRTRQLAALGLRDLTEGCETGRLTLPRIAVFEELADRLIQSRAAEAALVRLAQMARAVGIHLVLSTQRPDAETFSGLLRSNIPSRIALTVQKSSESRIILDETGAEGLTGKGDMLIKILGSQVTRIHGIHIVPDDIAACVRDRLGRTK